MLGELEGGSAGHFDDQSIDLVAALFARAASRRAVGCPFGDRDRGDLPPTFGRDRRAGWDGDDFDLRGHSLEPGGRIRTRSEEGDALSHRDVRLREERCCARGEHTGEIVARERGDAVVRSGCENEEPRADDDGLVLAREEDFAIVDTRRGRAVVKIQARKIWNGCAPRLKRPSGRDAVVRDQELDLLRREAPRHGETRGSCPDDQDIDLSATRAADRSRFVGQLAEPRHVPRDLLHDVRRGRHPGEKMMMVDALRKEPIGRPHQVELGGAEHVLRLHALAASAGRHARHDVRLAVDPEEAPVASTSKAIRTVGPVELGTAAKSDFARRDGRPRSSRHRARSRRAVGAARDAKRYLDGSLALSDLDQQLRLFGPDNEPTRPAASRIMHEVPRRSCQSAFPNKVAPVRSV